MTKQVRIENADTAPYQVSVQTQDKDASGEWQNTGQPQLLQYPTAMAQVHLTSTRRFIVEEIT